MNASCIEEVQALPVLTLEVPLTGNETSAKQLSWIARNFLWTICENYLRATPRRDEALVVAMMMVANAEKSNQISKVEADSICNELTKIEEQVYPGSSKI